MSWIIEKEGRYQLSSKFQWKDCTRLKNEE